jgi:tetratricopeptide (TPR) repeat protein
MKRTLQISGLLLTLLYGAVIVWLYVRQPRSLQELKTQASVEVNAYRVNQENFDEAIRQFNAGRYEVAVEQFRTADPAATDPRTQFFIAYSFYMLGRGRIYDDDEKFKEGLAAVERCIEHAPNHIYEIDRTDLEIRNAGQLRQRLREGLEVTPSDFNPIEMLKKKQ